MLPVEPALGGALNAVSRPAGELHLGQDQHVTVEAPLATVRRVFGPKSNNSRPGHGQKASYSATKLFCHAKFFVGCRQCFCQSSSFCSQGIWNQFCQLPTARILISVRQIRALKLFETKDFLVYLNFLELSELFFDNSLNLVWVSARAVQIARMLFQSLGTPGIKSCWAFLSMDSVSFSFCYDPMINDLV